MPNHVKNKLQFTGDQSEIKNMLEMIQQDMYGIGSIDFNKLIPMPDSLHIESGSNTLKGIKFYRDFINAMMLAHKVKNLDDLEISDVDEKKYLNAHPEIDRDIWSLGKMAYVNEYLYGAQTWYEWSIQNWGTKWNSYGYSKDISIKNNTIEFETAWTAPHPVIRELASQYPSIRFDHVWADEDIGENCGSITYENGEMIGYCLPESRVESVEFACKVWGYKPEDIDLCLNATETDYIYPDEGSEIAHLDDKEILFTTERLTDEDVPLGLHVYHLRENLSNDPMSYIEKVAKDDFAATIITREELDLGSTGSIALIPSEHLRFTDEVISMRDFLNGDMDQAYLALPYDESGLSQTM